MITRFPTLRLEGGLISSDQIDRIADQRIKEFTIDDIAAAWSDIRSYWTIFQNNLAKLPEDDLATSITRNRWMMPFFSTLGYDLSSPRTAAEADGQTFAISNRAGKDESSPPIHIVGIRQSLDRRPESGRPRLAPHSLVQEYLNRTEHLWGIVTNGSTLRILRDSHLLRKQAYIEFDLEQILKDELFADFALLYRLIHVSRLPKGIDDADLCLLEQYHRQTVEQGGRVRDHLRDGVEKALIRFGNGFLNHQRNSALRSRVQDKSLEPFEYYQQLLRLIYRFLFLMVSEERNLITDNMSYREHYSISRIRRLVEVRAAYTQQEDLWLGLATTFRLFQDESLGPLLNVPILNGDLFDPERTSEINEISLTNRDLLTATWDICMYREKENAPWRRVNYAALDVEELGSVYESLLDFQPVFVQKNGKPEFLLLTGTERKSTGSYYTPPELVNELIQSTLVPTMKDRLAGAKTGEEKANALLGMTICDPACGSGHFLLAAARTIGRELAKARTGDEEPAPEQMRIAIRDTITHCIYGVDKNPLAVDLCKVALWLEGHTKAKPLTFLDHRIRCGDSLIGVFDLKVLEEGIPEEAYTQVINDDKSVAKELKKQNKEYKKHESQNRSLIEFDPALNALTASRQQMNAITDDKPEYIRKKKELFSEFQQEGTPWCKDKTACDLWTSAFFIELTKEKMLQRVIPTTNSLRQYFTGELGVENLQVQTARRLAKKHRFFHWQLEFPEVFAKGGFDCNLGNPPWGIVELNPIEFFSTRDPKIANAQNMAARQKMINNLERDNPSLFSEYKNNKRIIENYQKFIHSSRRFPYTSYGRINSMALFAELTQQMNNMTGRAGLILPIGIATDSFNQHFFSNLIEKKSISRIIGFENEDFIFPNIHHAFKFCALTVTGNAVKNPKSDLAFFCRNFSHISQNQRHFELSADEFFLINPNTRVCPIFRTKNDAELIKKIYNRVPVLINEKQEQNPWNLNLTLMFMMNIDSKFFENERKEDFLPLYEGKLIHQFNHRYTSFENATQANLNSGILPQTSLSQKIDPCFSILPKYWVPVREITSRIHESKRKWFLGYRRITSSVVERTVIAVIFPFSGSSDGLPICLSPNLKSYLSGSLMANFNSLIFDYCARQKIGGTHLDFHQLKQLPVIPPDRYTPADLAFIVPRVLELTYTAWDIKAFADDVWRDADDAMKALLRQQWEANKAVTGGHGWKPPEWVEIEKDGIPLPPFKWDEERRAVLRAELDALYARLYGLSRDELRYILDPADVYGPEFPGETFRVLKEKEIKKYGEYRTRRLVLEAWDRMEKL
ncbi:MAG: N-6 DNA Methylase [Methanoregula sp. PtaU1.Bin051]|nr:MAG: N-6 DNA Methylase [Methanoregula sp. PtaU1.Bin051]